MAQGRTSSSTVTMVAAKMDGNDWWKQMMFEFVRESPAKEQWQDRIAGFMDGLDEISLDAEGMKTLQAVVKDTHHVVRGFRPESIKDVTDKVCSTLRRLGKEVEEEHGDSDELSEDVLLLLEAATHDASSLMPQAEATSLAESVCSFNQSMRSRKHAVLAKSVLEALHSIAGCGTANGEEQG